MEPRYRDDKGKLFTRQELYSLALKCYHDRTPMPNGAGFILQLMKEQAGEVLKETIKQAYPKADTRGPLRRVLGLKAPPMPRDDA